MLGFHGYKTQLQGKIVKLRSLLTVGAAATALMSAPLMAADQAMSPEQKKQFEQVIHDYLVTNPEVLIEASQALQKKQQDAMMQQAQSAIKANAAKLFSGSMTLVGNPKGDVTVVEFFDYQCIHCKKMAPVLKALIGKDRNLRVVYKEFPIFGKNSEMASRAALAAAMQGKYMAMHEALIKLDKRLDPTVIDEAAKSVGLDMAKLKTDMNSQAVTDMLEQNRQLAEQLHLMGTPAFIVAKTPNGQYQAGTESAFIPGATSEEALQNLIKEAQAK